MTRGTTKRDDFDDDDDRDDDGADWEELSASQTLALAALLAGDTVTDAARKAKVSRETVSRWISRDPVFIANYRLGKTEILESTRAGLRKLTTAAVNTIGEMMTDSTAPHSARLRAALAVLEAVGATQPDPPQPHDPEDVKIEMEGAELARRLSGALGF